MRTIRVGKLAQGLLLAALTGTILVVTLLVEGRPGVRTNLAPFEDLHRLAAIATRRGILSNGFLFEVTALAGNLAVFALWAWLAWRFLDGKGRSRWRNDVDVLLAGTLFSVGIETIQLFLPTRAADINDVFWNVFGTLTGVAIAHARSFVRFEWE
ncbi:MAG: VanZ family protein [Acidithiobacillales bacterium]